MDLRILLVIQIIITTNKNSVHGILPIADISLFKEVPPLKVTEQTAIPHSYPYVAGLIFDTSIFCSGSVISPKYILTAGSCMKDRKSVEVTLGASDLNSEEQGQINIVANEFIIHPQFKYSKTIVRNDIGLIKLPVYLNLTKYIEPVELPDKTNIFYENFLAIYIDWDLQNGMEGDSEGSKVLKYIVLRIVSNKNCEKMLNTRITKNMMCTVSMDILHSGCNDNSGAPLVIDNQVIGVLSYTKYKCVAGSPNVYTRVGPYKEWIASRTDIEL